MSKYIETVSFLYFLLCVCYCKSHEVEFSCGNEHCIIKGEQYVQNATYISRTLYANVVKVEIERFDDNSKLDLSNLPNVKRVHIDQEIRDVCRHIIHLHTVNASTLENTTVCYVTQVNSGVNYIFIIFNLLDDSVLYHLAI